MVGVDLASLAKYTRIRTYNMKYHTKKGQFGQFMLDACLEEADTIQYTQCGPRGDIQSVCC